MAPGSDPRTAASTPEAGSGAACSAIHIYTHFICSNRKKDRKEDRQKEEQKKNKRTIVIKSLKSQICALPSAASLLPRDLQGQSCEDGRRLGEEPGWGSPEAAARPPAAPTRDPRIAAPDRGAAGARPDPSAPGTDGGGSADRPRSARPRATSFHAHAHKKKTRNLFVLKPKAGRGCGAPPQRHRGRRAHLRAPLRPRAAHRRSRHRRFFGGRSRSPRLPKGNFEIRFAALKPSLKTSVLSK